MTLFTPEMLALLKAEARLEADSDGERARYTQQEAIATRIMTGAADMYMISEDRATRCKVTSEAEMRAFAQKYGSGEAVITPAGLDEPITPIGKFDRDGALSGTVLGYILPRPEWDAAVEMPDDEELLARLRRGDYNLL